MSIVDGVGKDCQRSQQTIQVAGDETRTGHQLQFYGDEHEQYRTV